MTPVEIDAMAEQLALKYAPRAKHDPVHAGIVGGAATTVVVTIFCALAGLRSDAFPLATVATATIGYCIPYFYFRHQNNAFYAAWAKETLALRNAENSVGSSEGA